MKKRLAKALAVGALMAAMLPGVVAANADATAVCKHGGWHDLVRADGSTFRNQGQCVSYAPRGGTPYANAFEAKCIDDAGTYGEPDDVPTCEWTSNVPYTGVVAILDAYESICTSLGYLHTTAGWYGGTNYNVYCGYF